MQLNKADGTFKVKGKVDNKVTKLIYVNETDREPEDSLSLLILLQVNNFN